MRVRTDLMRTGLTVGLLALVLLAGRGCNRADAQYGMPAIGVLPTAPTTTVSGLPTCNTAARGRLYVVTDALLPAALATVADGGAVVVLVVCNGTNWIVG